MKTEIKKKNNNQKISFTNDKQVNAMTSYYNSKEKALVATESIEEKKLRIEQRRLEIYEDETKQKQEDHKYDRLKKVSDYNFDQLKKRIELKKMDSSYSNEQLKELFPLVNEN